MPILRGSLARLTLLALASAVARAQVPTQTALGTSATSIAFGQPVTLTATVTPSTATGYVAFYAGPRYWIRCRWLTASPYFHPTAPERRAIAEGRVFLLSAGVCVEHVERRLDYC
jgi:hypothetical protein